MPGGEGSDETGASGSAGDSDEAGSEGDATAGGGGEDDADGELNDALEDFDGTILEEREVIAQRRREGAGEGAGSTGPAGTTTGAVAGGRTTTAAYVPPVRNAPTAPPAGSPRTSNIEDEPDARDDDVVARQLREAAQNETDPELKEKLWEEYRRYKGSS